MPISLRPVDTANKPIEEGDCGVILRKNGTFQIFSTGHINPNALSEIQLEQGLLLTAIALCLKTPGLKENLLKMASEASLGADNPFASSIN